MDTATETAVASHPPSAPATKDLAKPKRAVTPEKPTAEEAEAPKPRPAHEEHHPSSEDASPLQQHSEPQDEGSAVTNGAAYQSPRRGIWEWAKAGTGKLNIIGRLPHSERKGPTSAPKTESPLLNGAQEHARMTESHDDFYIPSAIATEPDNVERQETAMAAKIEGLGISSLSTILSPNDFSQTKHSSDDLIANASETTGSPSPMMMQHADWNNGDDTTPTTSKPTSPTTPDTPTPPQRRSDSIMEMPKPRVVKDDAPAKVDKKTPQKAQREAAESPAPKSGPSPTKSGTNGTGSPRRIPTYKIALASSLLSPARRSASAAR